MTYDNVNHIYWVGGFFSVRPYSIQIISDLLSSHKEPFIIADEYDFQDLIHCLLTIRFIDVRPEDWVPEYAGGSAKVDFHLPEVSMLVETKIAFGFPLLLTKIVFGKTDFRV